MELRSLQQPRPLWVQTDPAGRPLALRRPGWPLPRAVARIQDRWRIDDEWWRETPVSRMYYQLQLEGDRIVTVYQDLPEGPWHEQRY